MMLIVLTIFASVTNAAEKEKAQHKDNKIVREEPKKKPDQSTGHGRGENSGSGQATHPSGHPTYVDTFGQIKPDHKEASLQHTRKWFGNH